MTHAVTPTPTPNPNAMRFGLGSAAVGAKSLSYGTPEAAAGTPWAEALFRIEGVAGLFAVNDFVTVTKVADASWDAIVPKVLDTLATAEFA